jgi:predicted metalloprotease with PDZ domain
MHFKSTAFSAGLVFFATGASAHAEIDYHLSVLPADSKLAVEITVPAQAGPLSFQMPSWMPGSYVYGDFFNSVHDVAAVDGQGKTLDVTHPDKNTWTVNAPGNGPVKFTYWVPSGGPRRFTQSRDTSYIQVSGAATYMYVVGRKLENCGLTVDVPAGWPIMVGLDADGGSANKFVAPFYDVLADNPISTGDLIVEHYTLRGRDHAIVLEGSAKSKVDKERLLKDCRFVSAAETDFFGGAPYHKYVWHFVVFDAPDGAGGLEHLSSTQITLAAGEGPRAQSVLAHEYFHLWNVKRIRAKVLGPFDYLVLPKTGNIWWLEGVTDYYATLLPYRYGEWDRKGFFDGLIRNLNLVRSNPARLEISPYQSSYRVAEANDGRGNSNGYKISYYNLGWLCGLCLDTEIRARTNNRHSLDDVARALYQLCKDNKPGFEEDEIRKQCIRFGGPEMGAFYDQVVMSPGELPVEAQLAKMGLKIVEQDQTFADGGFNATALREGHGARVEMIHGVADGKLMTGDVLLSINGHSLDSESGMDIARTLRAQMDGIAVGTPLALTVKRADQTVSVTIDPASATRKVRSVEEDPAANASAIALREGWLQTKVASIR